MHCPQGERLQRATTVLARAKPATQEELQTYTHVTRMLRKTRRNSRPDGRLGSRNTLNQK